MAIPVVCPGCGASFRVSDTFAGQTGPCPKCKAPIDVPAKTDDVVVHSPDVHGGKDSKGRAIAKPLERLDMDINHTVLLIALGCTAVSFLAAWLLGDKLQDKFALRGLGLLLVTPALAVVGYYFLRDREKLEVFGGRDLVLRTAICAAVYLVLWAGYGFVRFRYEFPTEVFQLFIIVPPMLALGALGALGCYELDFGNAFLHYCFHVLVVLALCYVAGMHYLFPSMT